MLKKYFKLAILFMILVNLLSIRGYADNSQGFIKKINRDIDCEFCEAVVQASFYTNKLSNDELNELLGDIQGDANSVLGQVSKRLKVNVKVNSYRDTQKIIVSVNIKDEKISYEMLKEIESDLAKALNNISNNVEYSLSVKTKILSSTREEIKDYVLQELNKDGARDTQVVNINNGYSIISSIDRNEGKKVLDRNIDFNCAIVKYSSGCYLIVGTPDILITY